MQAPSAKQGLAASLTNANNTTPIKVHNPLVIQKTADYLFIFSYLCCTKKSER
ncbi:MAG: hypothetical protein QM594_19335 [Niabella sp.]